VEEPKTIHPDFPALWRRGGFSLVEVILAIGIFGMSVVVVVGLLSTLLTSSKESWQETRAAQIARQVLNDLRPAAGESQGNLVRSPGNVESVDLHTPATLQASYTVEGQPVAQGDANAYFQASITLSAITNTPASPGTAAATDALNTRTNFSEVRVDIKPLASGTNTRPFQFSSRIAPKALQSP